MMARWDDILTLPVQDPSTLDFSSSDLNWFKVEGWRQNVDNVALIPFARVDDFVKGESSNVECPTKFRVEARRKKAEDSSYKPRVDGYLEYILYWCCYGPDDHRKGGTARPSRRCIKPSKKKSAGRPHTKRGCMCHFIVKRLYAQPSVALIIYNEMKHVDKTGSPCHGPLDSKASGTLAVYAPYISEELRQKITSMIYAGLSVESIMQNHAKSVEMQGGPSNRDDFVSQRYVRALERDIRGSAYELDSDDALSIKMWVDSHQKQVFYYQESCNTADFILGIQTEWQMQQMIYYGNNSLIAADSSCGVKKFKYPLYTVLVFDPNRIAIPIAWIINASFQSHDVHKWMKVLHDRVCAKDSTWRVNGFIVDDATTDIAAIRDVFQCPILLCLWRVRRAWHRNITKKCSNAEIQREMLKRLGCIMYDTWKGLDIFYAMEDFMEDFIEHSAFLEYFKAQWMPKIETWVSSMRILPLASQEACAALEAYHSRLKSKLLNESDIGAYGRADWLVHKLTTKIHSYFWFDQFSMENDLFGYVRDEKHDSTSWHRALFIADSDVILNKKDLRFAKVVSQSDSSKTYTVWNPGSEFAFCECSWSMLGNLCKHVIKVGAFFCDRQLARPSMALQTYYQALLSLSQCPPNGSVALDHAITLAMRMRQDLKQLVEPANNGGVNSLLTPVPVKWIVKKSRTQRRKERTIDVNNDTVCGNGVTINAEGGPVNEREDVNNDSVTINAEGGPVNEREDVNNDSVTIYAEGGPVNEREDVNNDSVCRNGVTINAEGGPVNEREDVNNDSVCGNGVTINSEGGPVNEREDVNNDSVCGNGVIINAEGGPVNEREDVNNDSICGNGVTTNAEGGAVNEQKEMPAEPGIALDENIDCSAK